MAIQLKTYDALIDIDNILWNQTKVLYRLLKKDYPGMPHFSKWTINFYEPFMSKHDFFTKIRDLQGDQNKYRPFPDASFFLAILRHKISMNIHICSHRPTEQYDIVTKWLNDNRLIYDKVYLSDNSDKMQFVTERTKLVVDDHPEFLERLRKRNLLRATLNYSHNMNVRNVMRADSLTELANKLVNYDDESE